MRKYKVYCAHPDGGDVIEGRKKPVVEVFENFNKALWALYCWYRPGPNGPLRSGKIYRSVDDGEWEPLDLAALREEAELLGGTVLGRRVSQSGGWYPAGFETREYSGAKFAASTELARLANRVWKTGESISIPDSPEIARLGRGWETASRAVVGMTIECDTEHRWVIFRVRRMVLRLCPELQDDGAFAVVVGVDLPDLSALREQLQKIK